MKGDDEKCFAAGCDAYLPKPIDREELIRTISNHLASNDDGLSDEIDSVRDHVDELGRLCSGEKTHEQDPPKESVVIPNDDEAVDWAHILSSWGGEEVIREVVKVFLEDGRRSVELIADAMKAENAEDVQLYAHRLKGSARHVAAIQLSEKAHRLELAGRRKDMAAAVGLLVQVQAEFEEVTSLLAQRAGLKQPNNSDERPAEHHLLPRPGRRLGENMAKLKNKTVPCRYKRCSIHADLPIHCWSSNLHIGSSASLLSLLHLQISAKVHTSHDLIPPVCLHK